MPDASALLDVWETGEREHPIDRALTILAAFTGSPRAELAALGIHRRDALLIRARILAFGEVMAGASACTACGCEAELELRLIAPPEMEEGGTLALGERRLAYRVPNSYDLAAAATCPDLLAIERCLRARCVADADALDDEALEAAEAALQALSDPSEIELRGACPACDAPLVPRVDLGEMLWHEIAAYARRLLDDVDALASRYGWSERDILSLSDVRRRRYVEAFA